MKFLFFWSRDAWKFYIVNKADELAKIRTSKGLQVIAADKKRLKKLRDLLIQLDLD